MKNPIMQVIYFLNGPILVCFFVILFYIHRDWLLLYSQRLRNVAPVLPLKSKLSGKFQRFNAINRSIEMLKIVEFSKISIKKKLKNCKIFCKAQAANHLKKFIQSPPSHRHQIKPYLLRLGNKNFLGRYVEIYRHLLSKCFKNAVAGRQEMV